jgi:hypothetical protein
MALTDSDTKARLKELACDVRAPSFDICGRFLASKTETWRRVIHAHGMMADG